MVEWLSIHLQKSSIHNYMGVLAHKGNTNTHAHAHTHKHTHTDTHTHTHVRTHTQTLTDVEIQSLADSLGSTTGV